MEKQPVVESQCIELDLLIWPPSTSFQNDRFSIQSLFRSVRPISDILWERFRTRPLLRMCCQFKRRGYITDIQPIVQPELQNNKVFGVWMFPDTTRSGGFLDFKECPDHLARRPFLAILCVNQRSSWFVAVIVKQNSEMEIILAKTPVHADQKTRHNFTKLTGIPKKKRQKELARTRMLALQNHHPLFNSGFSL